MNLTKKIATLGALAVVGAFTVSNAANVGVINEEAIYTGYNGFGAIQMQIDKLRAEYGPKLEGEFKKLNNFKNKHILIKVFVASKKNIIKKKQVY